MCREGLKSVCSRSQGAASSLPLVLKNPILVGSLAWTALSVLQTHSEHPQLWVCTMTCSFIQKEAQGGHLVLLPGWHWQLLAAIPFLGL